MKKTISINVCDIHGTRRRQVLGTHRKRTIYNFCADTDENMLEKCKDYAVTQGFTHFIGVIERGGKQITFKGEFSLKSIHSHGVINTLGNVRAAGTAEECLSFILENKSKDALNGKISDLLFVQRNYQCRTIQSVRKIEKNRNKKEGITVELVRLTSGDTGLFVNGEKIVTAGPDIESASVVEEAATNLADALNLTLTVIEMPPPPMGDWNWEDIQETLPSRN